MKVFSVYGFSKSGKTSTIENLIKGLKNRGYSVGTVKKIPNEDFAMDVEGTDTDRHRKAGAEMVTVRGIYETDLLIPRKLSIEEILKFYRQEYVIVEGSIDLAVPKILCAKNLEEVEMKIDDTVFAISGVISNDTQEYQGIPVINAIKDTQRLLDLVEEKVFEKLPNLACGLCGKTCRQMAIDIIRGQSTRDDCKINQGHVSVTINGKNLEMVPFVQDMVESVIKALLSQLKGYERGDISINISNMEK